MNQSKPLESLIVVVRGKNILVDADLAGIYGVTTKRLNEQVKRNIDRFPQDFAFRLTLEEKERVVASCGHLARLKYSKALPWVFTEHGAIMAAMILNSPEAITMSVYVVRAFVQMREQIAANAAILKRLGEIDRKLLGHDDALLAIWTQLEPLLGPPPPAESKRRIGFKQDEG
jgi:hypothetical protein